jgi:hypothetical protein
MRIVVAAILCVMVAASVVPHARETTVVVERLPAGGIAPQVVTDASGVMHIVYFSGASEAGNVSYVRRLTDGRYTAPIRVNSQPGSAISIGTVRGPQIALGRGGRVHVVWNGSNTAQPRPASAMPFLYSRLDDSGRGFEPQRNLITRANGTDGGGSVAAGRDGQVYVAWHANSERTGEDHRMVYLARSSDDGTRFMPEKAISPEPLGACGCCSMRATVDRAGTLLFLFRAATRNVQRDMTLLTSKDRGETFATVTLDPWRLEACPLSSAAMAEGPRGVTAAWETNGQIRFADVSPAASTGPSVKSAPGSGQRKHPAIAFNVAGEMLLAWADGTAWAKGGTVAWQLYDSSGRPTSSRGSLPGLAAWALAAVAPLPDGRFLILY